MYKLPNGNTVDEAKVIHALLDDNVNTFYYLDKITGEVHCSPNVAKIKNYIAIPRIPVTEQIFWMKDFIEFVWCEEEEDEGISDALAVAYKKNSPYETFLTILSKAGSQWVDSWNIRREEEAAGKMEEWFATLPFEVTYEWEYDDGCGACMLLKEDDDKILKKN